MAEDAPRLYLITPLLVDAASFQAAFESALKAGDIACVYVRAASDANLQTIAKYLAPIAQRCGAACLLGDPQVAAEIGADGVHVDTPGAALEGALKAMKPKYIAGVGGLVSRDDAMRAGESGVDYLMFGGPGEPLTTPQIRERIVWCAEIFNVPCVAYAGALADIPALIGAGTDFVALESAIWDDLRGPAAAVAAATRLMAGRTDE
jgi:thiamine-phosphate pyrophosphorylase